MTQLCADCRARFDPAIGHYCCACSTCVDRHEERAWTEAGRDRDFRRESAALVVVFDNGAA